MYRNTPLSGRHSGWFRDNLNSRLELYVAGTKVADASSTVFTPVGALAAGTTVTGGTGIVATTGNITATTGDVRITVGNERLGVVSAFGTTEPTSAVVFKTGTAPAGAIATSGGLFSSTTVVRKIIADGTVSNVET